ncbi:TPA: restriction endonuclease subunit S [Enterococcus faecium]|nr:restriction endonuclease subunit S [Enterococcus faecium]
MELTKCKLGELITQRREKNDGSDLPICGVSKDGLIPPKQKDADTSIYNVFYRDDFIFNPARMELNSIAINDMYDRAICSSLYEVFYVHRTDLLLPHYLELIIRQKWFTRYCKFLGQGSAREYCRFGNISEIEIEFPPIEEQQKIVEYNTAIENRIALKQKINDNLVAVGTASIQKNVGRGALINLTEAEMDSLIFPEDFKIKTVSEFCAETKSGSTPSRTNNEYWENGTISWVKSGEVHNNITLQTEEYITSLGLSESSTKLLPKDTVLMAMYGVTAGEVGYLAIEATTNQAICGMICRSKAEAAYLYFSLIQSQAAISRLSNGGAQDNLSKNFIDNIKIVVPPSEFIEKLNLAAIVEQMTLNTKEITLLEELQATVLAQLSSR